MRVACLFVLAALGPLSACSSSASLTCDYLADPENCWARAAEAMAQCMSDRETPATLAADRGSCEFVDGVRVVFDTPLPLDIMDLERLAFTVQDAGGATCARFVDTFQNRMELTGGGETVVSELLAGRDFHLRCPGGPDYSASFDLLFTCTTPYSAPTDGFDVNATGFEFSISAVTTPGVMFSCSL